MKKNDDINNITSAENKKEGVRKRHSNALAGSIGDI